MALTSLSNENSNTVGSGVVFTAGYGFLCDSIDACVIALL
jgi:hypothetical protein